jgi:hypothetical protein
MATDCTDALRQWRSMTTSADAADPERNSPAVDATGWDRMVADDVTAPSARQHTDAGAERLPDL